MEVLWITLAALAGGCLAMQGSANSALKSVVGDPRTAAFLSICGTFATAVVFLLMTRQPMPSVAAVRGAAWWNWLGGPLGACVVLAGAALTQRLGSAAYIAAIVGGQLIFSLALDHYGLMNLPQQTLTPGRLLGAAMVFAGVLCVKYL